MLKKLLIIITTLSFYVLPSVHPDTTTLKKKLDYSKKVKTLKSKSNNYLRSDVSKKIEADVKILEDKLSNNATSPINLREFSDALESVRSECNIANLGATPRIFKDLSARIRTMQTTIATMQENASSCHCCCVM